MGKKLQTRQLKWRNDPGTQRCQANIGASLHSFRTKAEALT